VGNIGDEIPSRPIQVLYISNVSEDQQAQIWSEPGHTELELDVVVDGAGDAKFTGRLILFREPIAKLWPRYQAGDRLAVISGRCVAKQLSCRVI